MLNSENDINEELKLKTSLAEMKHQRDLLYTIIVNLAREMNVFNSEVLPDGPTILQHEEDLMTFVRNANAQSNENVTLHAELVKLKAELSGPESFETWHDAALDERLKRVWLQQQLKAVGIDISAEQLAQHGLVKQ